VVGLLDVDEVRLLLVDVFGVGVLPPLELHPVITTRGTQIARTRRIGRIGTL
jgi:hypothetical protein